MTMSRAARLAVLGAVLLTAGRQAAAQHLRFSNEYREPGIPDYATFKIGPFYSTATFSQSVGFRETWGVEKDAATRDRGMTGAIRENGAEIPMVSIFTAQNYLQISPYADIDASFQASYAHYPLGTQDDEWDFSLANGQDIYAVFGAEMRLTPYLRGRLSWRPAYVTDYVDLRGVQDNWAGSKFSRFVSLAAGNLDWLIAKDKGAGLALTREDVLPTNNTFPEEERTSHRASAYYEQQFMSLFAAGVQAAVYNTDFRDRKRADVTGEEYTLYLNGGKGMDLPVTERTTFRASVGYGTASTTSDAQELVGTNNATAGVIGSASLTTQLTKNVSHSLTYGRSQEVLFGDGLATRNSIGYSINAGEGWFLGPVEVGLATTFSSGNANAVDVPDYADWLTTLTARYPLTKYVTLVLDSAYDIRDNKPFADVPQDPSLAPELWYDYQTWTTRLTTSFQLTKAIDTRVYAEQSRRTSEFRSLDHSRGAAGFDLIYTHRF